MLAEQKITGFFLTAQGVMNITGGTHTETEASQPGGAEEKGHFHLWRQSDLELKLVTQNYEIDKVNIE